MAETEDTQSNIAAIRTRLDNIERMTRLSIASNPNSQTHIEELFRRRAGSADLYMALAEGPRWQDELTRILGKSQPTVSRIVAHLYESGLIDRVPQSGGVLWMWHDMERTLGISRVARRLVAKSPPKAGTSQQDAEDVSSD
jgi:DNA-binding transcriptional ArsR family regulator